MIVECPSCEAYVEAEEQGNYQYLRNQNQPSGRYVFLKCRNCGHPLLVSQENIGNMAEGDIWDTPVTMYPSHERYANPNLPTPLKLAIDEAHTCFKSRAYTATAIMCRKTLEGICASQNITERNLVRSLTKMKDDGVIDERLHQWADALRITGNEAAHGVETTIPREDAQDILDFTAAILDYVFSFKGKFDEFQQRRNPS